MRAKQLVRLALVSYIEMCYTHTRALKTFFALLSTTTTKKKLIRKQQKYYNNKNTL